MNIIDGYNCAFMNANELFGIEGLLEVFERGIINELTSGSVQENVLSAAWNQYSRLSNIAHTVI